MTRIDLVEAHQKVDDGGLAGPGRPDDRDRLTRSHVEVEVGDQRFAGFVLEVHVFKRNAPRGCAELDAGGPVRRLLVRSQELEYALSRGEARLQQVHLARDLGDRHRELARVLDEGLDVAERHGARRHPVTTEHRDRDVVEVGQELQRRLDDAGEELGSEARLVQLLVLLDELAERLAPMAEDLDQLVAGVRLLDLPVQCAGPLPLGRELDLGAPRDQNVAPIDSGMVIKRRPRAAE